MLRFYVAVSSAVQRQKRVTAKGELAVTRFCLWTAVLFFLMYELLHGAVAVCSYCSAVSITEYT